MLIVSHRCIKIVLCDLLLISNEFKHFIRIWVVLGLGLSPKNRTQSLQAPVRATSALPESHRKDYRPFIFQNNGSFQSALQVQLSIIAKYNHTEICIIQNFWKTLFKLTDPNRTEAYVNRESTKCLLVYFWFISFPLSLQVFHWRHEKEWLTNSRFIQGLSEASSTFSSLNSIKFRENKCCCELFISSGFLI